MRRIFFLASVFVVACSSSEENTVAGLDSAVDAVATDSTSVDSGSVDGSGDSSSEDTNAAETSAGDSATTDSATMMDAPSKDTAAADVASDGGQCKAASECRLFSSYCSTAPCACIPLVKGEPSPKCEGTMVACFVDPCASKTAGCTGGTCVAK